MNILQLFTRKTTTTTQGRKKNILELTTEEKAALEDDKNSGVSSAQSAVNLDLDINTVYNFRRSLTGKVQLPDPAKEKQAIKDSMELTKLQLECDATIQKMQLERLKFDKEIAEWKEDLYGEDQGSSNEMSIPDMIQLMQSFKDPNTQPSPNTGKTLPVATVNPSQNTAPAESSETVGAVTENQDLPLEDLTDDQIRDLIKVFAKEHKAWIPIAKSMPDRIICDRIANEMPSVSDKTILRAVEIFKGEF